MRLFSSSIIDLHRAVLLVRMLQLPLPATITRSMLQPRIMVIADSGVLLSAFDTVQHWLKSKVGWTKSRNPSRDETIKDPKRPTLKSKSKPLLSSCPNGNNERMLGQSGRRRTGDPYFNPLPRSLSWCIPRSTKPNLPSELALLS